MSKASKSKANIEDPTKLYISSGSIKAGRVPTISGGGVMAYIDQSHVMMGGGQPGVVPISSHGKPHHYPTNGSMYSAPLLPSSMPDPATLTGGGFGSSSSSASRRLTVGGDLGGGSYHGNVNGSSSLSSGSSSKKNTFSMYGTGSSNSLGHANGAGYPQHLESGYGVGVEDVSMRSRR